MPSQDVPESVDDETTDDLFLGGALTIRQPRTGYRAGLDAVLLAAACPVAPGVSARCLDCGAGAGVAGLALAHRVGGSAVTLVERNAWLAALAAHNCVINELTQRVHVVTADVTLPLATLAVLASAAGSYDHVIANPPYFAHGTGTRAPDPRKDASHAMAVDAFDGWARFAAAMLRPGGSYTIIQRPAAVPEILRALERRFGKIKVLPIYSRDTLPASRVLISAIKGSRAELQILPGRTLHELGSHRFKPDFDAILRGGTGLTF